MLTSEQLGIEPDELEALCAVRSWLAAGCPEEAKQLNSPWRRTSFAMEDTIDVKPCGTVCCIGGAMAIYLEKTPDEAHDYVLRGRTDALNSLFMGIGIQDIVHHHTDEGQIIHWNLNHITPQMALHAVTNFLNTGDPQWEAVVIAVTK